MRLNGVSAPLLSSTKIAARGAGGSIGPLGFLLKHHSDSAAGAVLARRDGLSGRTVTATQYNSGFLVSARSNIVHKRL